MKKIKFSHIYQKLLDSHNDVVDHATLHAVIPVQLEELHASFIDYDTDSGKYALPAKGKYLMLVFEKPTEVYVSDRNLFTTIRRFTPTKYDYYKNAVGEIFEVIIVD